MKNAIAAALVAFVFVAVAHAEDASAPPKAAATATEPMRVSPELMRLNTRVGVEEGHMNALLAERDAVAARAKGETEAINAQITALQKMIDGDNAVREKFK